MSAQHTPGLWIVHDNDAEAEACGIDPSDWCHWFDVRNSNGTTIAGVHGQEKSINEANARLIAAAPELLQSSEIALSWLESWGQHVGNCEGGDKCTCGLTRVKYDLSAAIAKPTGTSP